MNFLFWTRRHSRYSIVCRNGKRMNRRDFFQIAAGTLAAASATGWSSPSLSGKSSSKANLKLGTQHGDSDEILKVMAAFGVNHICAVPPSSGEDEDWSVEALERKREHIESFGLKADALRLLHPTYITKSKIRNVMMGKSPERDREIDILCRKIRNASRAGFPMLTYNLSILGVVRTGTTPGRGGAAYSRFNYEEATNRSELTEAGPVTSEESWDRISYFL